MRRYIARRVLYMVPTLFAISLVAFLIIQLPPGNFLTAYIAQLSAQGQGVDGAQIRALEERYGLNDPVVVQYWRWIRGIVLHGDFGQSFEHRREVSDLIWDRIGLTLVLAVSTLILSWVIAFPIGVYSAVRQYSAGDYVVTFIGFIGLATPNFMLALLFAWASFRYFGQSVGGIVSPEYADAAWNLGKVMDVVSNLWIPVLIIGTAGTAALIRVLRANLLDEAGYDERSGGVRLAPNGAPVSFDLSVPTDFRPDIIDSMEMVIGFWDELDIDVDLDTEDRSLWQNNREENEHDANVWSGDAGLRDAMYDARWYAPVHDGESNFGIPWAKWFRSDGADPRSTEPPDDVKEHLEMYRAVEGEPDPDLRDELMADFLSVSQERFYAIGISLTPPGYGIVADHFHNVPESMPSSSVYNDPGPTNPEQYFIEE